MKKEFIGISFINLVDFDVLYGYCWDVVGYVYVIEEFDLWILELFEVMEEDDLLMIIVDYGNDLIFIGIDYIWEYVLLLVYSKKMKE